MATKKRFSLDERSDDGPLRNIWGAFSQYDGSKGHTARGNGHESSNATTEDWGGVVTGAVKLANRIITEQIELGKKVAGQLNDQVYGFGGSVNAPQDLAESVLRTVTELSTTWVKAMSDMSSMVVGAVQQSSGRSVEADPAPRPAPELDARLRTSRQAEIVAHLSPVTAGSRLVVGPLVSDVADLPPLTETSTANYRPFVTVTVPDDHPQGTYFGAVFDKSLGQAIGWITVTVVDPPKKPAQKSGTSRAKPSAQGAAR